MTMASSTQQFVLLPASGLHARGPSASGEAQAFLRAAAEVAPQRGEVPLADGRGVRVLDSIGDDGAKLVEASLESVLAIRSLHPGLRVVPVVYYTPAVAPLKQVSARAGAAAAVETAATTVTVGVVSRTDNSPVAGAFVVAFTNYAAGAGAQGVTDAQGQVSLGLGAGEVGIERLYVYPTNAYWTLLVHDLRLTDGMQFTLEPIDLGYCDGLRYYYGDAADDDGQGVTVAVVDTGVAGHPDLVISGGANTVVGEDPGDFGDNGEGHGTHVAGIVAARGRPPSGIRGVAPGVSLRSYRVFGQGSRSASSFAIAKAIDQAVADGCDLINMSLGGGPFDMLLKAAVEDARAGGSACIIAAGNNGRGPVSFPASDEMALAVSALGRKGTFPEGTAEEDEVVPPFGTDEAEFIGAFSNIGPQIDLTAPGVGIVSTYPGTYAEISGTSMACPAATGVAARLLAGSDMLAMPRDGARSDAIVKALLASAGPRGFPPIYQGHGLPGAD